MSFKPDIPETPVYKAKPNISKQYSQQSEVQKGKIFDNKESLILVVKLKAPDAHEKLCRAGTQRWPRAHCPLVRYNYMTSNSVKSVNACSVIYRKELVLKLAETYRAMVQEWYYKRRQPASNMTYEITDWAVKKVAKKRMKSATWVVNGVNAYQYEVSD
nr:transposase, MuDR, MULE transposase domain protein [Tanacetum cinerariifolium]